MPGVPGRALQAQTRVQTRVQTAWLQRLKLSYDQLLLSFVFNFKLRRYRVESMRPALALDLHLHDHVQGLYDQIRQRALIQYTTPFTTAGRCWSTPG